MRRISVHKIAGQAHLGAEHVLAKRIPRQAEPVLQSAQIQTLAGKRQLQPVANRERGALHVETVIAAVDVGCERDGAKLVARAVPRQGGPRHDAAATTAFDHRYAAGGEQAPVAGQGMQRREHPGHRSSKQRDTQMPAHRCTPACAGVVMPSWRMHQATSGASSSGGEYR